MIKNEEGYADPTYDGAYKIIRKAREIFKAYGFEVVERIALKNIRTGKIYR